MTLDIEVKERRLVQRILMYWRDLAPEGELPPPASVNPEAVGDMWRCCFLLDINSEVSTFTYLGAAHVAHLGEDLTGQPVSAAGSETLLGAVLGRLEEVLLRRIPVASDGTIEGPGGEPVPYRSILLPLGKDGREVSGILGAANCRLPDFK